MSEFKWYVVRTKTNKEEIILEKILKESKDGILKDKINNAIAPKEKIISLKKGERIYKERFIFPNYVFVSSNALDDLKDFIKDCPNAMGLLKTKTGKTKMVREKDIKKFLIPVVEEEQIVECGFIKGQKIKISDGPFSGFDGIVEQVKNRKIKVMVSIFGSKSLIELDSDQITEYHG
jgi:transcriptional antiterminator NusG